MRPWDRESGCVGVRFTKMLVIRATDEQEHDVCVFYGFRSPAPRRRAGQLTRLPTPPACPEPTRPSRPSYLQSPTRLLLARARPPNELNRPPPPPAHYISRMPSSSAASVALPTAQFHYELTDPAENPLYPGVLTVSSDGGHSWARVLTRGQELSNEYGQAPILRVGLPWSSLVFTAEHPALCPCGETHASIPEPEATEFQDRVEEAVAVSREIPF